MGYRAPILLVICACLSQHPPNLCLTHGEQIFPSSEGRRENTERTLLSGSEFLFLSSGCRMNTPISNFQPNVRNSLHQRRQRIWSPLIHQLVLAEGGVIDWVALNFLSPLWEMGEGLSVYVTVMDACLSPLSVLNLFWCLSFPACLIVMCVCVCVRALNVP